MFDNLLYNILTIQESSTWVWDRNLLNHWKRAFFPIHFAAHCCQKWQKVTLNPQTGLFWQSFFVVRAGLWVVNGQTEGPSRALDLETSEPRLIVIVKAPELITSNYHNLELITSNCNIEEFVPGKYMWIFFQFDIIENIHYVQSIKVYLEMGTTCAIGLLRSSTPHYFLVPRFKGET